MHALDRQPQIGRGYCTGNSLGLLPADDEGVEDDAAAAELPALPSNRIPDPLKGTKLGSCTSGSAFGSAYHTEKRCKWYTY